MKTGRNPLWQNLDPFDIRSPYAQLEIERRIRLVLAIINGSFYFLVPFALFVALTLDPQGSNLAYLAFSLCVGTVPAAWVARWLVKKGRPAIGAYLFLLYIIGLVAINSLILEGIYPIVVPTLLLINIIAGMMLRTSHSYVFGVVSAIVYITLRLITADYQFPVQMPGFASLGTEIFIIALAFVFAVFLNNLATRDMRRSLDDATFDLMRMNKEVQDASDRKSQFTARTSHELRTPLSAIIVFADLSLREAYGPLNDKMRNAQQHIANSARHLKRIINDLLDLSKIEAGELEIDLEPYAVTEIVDVIESTCLPIANEKGLAWSMAIDSSLPPLLMGDAERVSQIAVNLAGNAVKFTEQGNVSVQIGAVDDRTWHIVVTDSGPGIPEDQHEKVFEAYRSLDRRSSRSVAKSTGLGLAIARNLAELMGGEISIQSELGVGSTFEVCLPLVVPDGNDQPVRAIA